MEKGEALVGLPGRYLVFMKEKKDHSGLLHQRRTLSAVPDQTHRGAGWHHVPSSRKERNGFDHGSERRKKRCKN